MTFSQFKKNSFLTRLVSATCAVLLLPACYESGQTADPVVEDFPIAYIKRPIPIDEQNELRIIDVRDLDSFNAGGDLYLKDRASGGSLERNITFEVTNGQGDVKDLESSFDGKKIIFAMRLPEEDNTTEPTWNIWEYNRVTRELKRIISSDITAEAGHDIAPHYLPDGRIVFTSTRQRQGGAILLDEGKPKYTAQTEDRDGPAFVLHVMNSDGTDIHQISFNQSHDLDPTINSNGEVVFVRWDNANTNDSFNLYKMRPDGTELEILYGAHSHETGTEDSTVQFLQPREMPDGRFVATIKPFRSDNGGGDIIAIDTANYIDYNFPTHSTLPVDGNVAQTSLIPNEIITTNEISRNGRYRSVFPLWDGTRRLLVSWTPCRLLEEDVVVLCTEQRLAQESVQAAPPLYGVYIYNLDDNTHIPLTTPQEGIIIEEVITAQKRTPPPVLFDKQLDLELDASTGNAGLGTLHIRSVYDVDGRDASSPNIQTLANPSATTADNRPARFLRIVKAVPMPPRNVAQIPGSAFGPTRQLMREIIGYAPIEPDGSVITRVPANVPLMISVVDKFGRRLDASDDHSLAIGQRHNNWIQVKPGETKECNGCHEHSNGIPHGRSDGPPSAYLGAETSTQPFPGTNSLMIANMGESMAQTRARINCPANTNCADLLPSVDIIFDDIWTDTNVRPKDASFAYRYADLTTTPPTTVSCLTTWTSQCRIVINYENHIQEIWEASRTVLDQNMNLIDGTCNTCHNVVDINADAQVPEAQLDLSRGDGESARFNSYRELLFSDFRQQLNPDDPTQLIDFEEQARDSNNILIFDVDENGDLVPRMIRDTITPSMRATLAAPANSSRFFEIFESGAPHEGWLSDAELRLISEWLDIGAQYYNNPFDIE